jgi:hypothetical protein
MNEPNENKRIPVLTSFEPILRSLGEMLVDVVKNDWAFPLVVRIQDADHKEFIQPHMVHDPEPDAAIVEFGENVDLTAPAEDWVEIRRVREMYLILSDKNGRIQTRPFQVL